MDEPPSATTSTAISEVMFQRRRQFVRGCAREPQGLGLGSRVSAASEHDVDAARDSTSPTVLNTRRDMGYG